MPGEQDGNDKQAGDVKSGGAEETEQSPEYSKCGVDLGLSCGGVEDKDQQAHKVQYEDGQ